MTEWGVPLHDDASLFELLVLEGAQAGLSWETVLRKRSRYREVFRGFDPALVARMTPARIEKILQDPGIVRNRAKIESAVGNARALLRVSQRVRKFRRIPLAIRGRKTDREPSAASGRRSGVVAGVARIERRPFAPGFPFRRSDDLLRVHAGCRYGQRPSR